MSRTALLALAGVLVLSLGVSVSAAVVPWKKGDDKPDAATDGDAGSTDLKEKLGETQYKRLVSPIEAKLKLAKKTMEAYDKEMEKPVDKRSQRLLLGCKQRAAQYYLGAAMAAKQAANRNRDEAVKAAIAEEFQKPNEQKAWTFSRLMLRIRL